MSGHDSRIGTLLHIQMVQQYLHLAIVDLQSRQLDHDASKLESPERELFDEYEPRLRDTEYGTEEYAQMLEKMGVALKHHLEHNDHHPEHYSGGIKDMSLMALLEMLCDWAAARQRHANPLSIEASIAFNQRRFGFSDELASILRATARDLGLTESP